MKVVTVNADTGMAEIELVPFTTVIMRSVFLTQ